MELAYAGMLICQLISQDVDLSISEDRACVYKCQRRERPEVVYTDPQYWCPRTLYVDDDEK